MSPHADRFRAELPGVAVRLSKARRERPYTLTFAGMLLIPGILAIIYGNDVSKALSVIGADTVSRAMGVTFVVGCTLILAGVCLGRLVYELSGLVTLAAGALIYGLGVILGLGLGGMVAGPGFLGIAVASIMRVFSLADAAMKVAAPGVVGDES